MSILERAAWAGKTDTVLSVIEIIGAPFDLCGAQLGSRLGPASIRLAGLSAALERMQLSAVDAGDVPVDLTRPPGPGLRNFDALLSCVGELRRAVALALAHGRVPLVLGGEHTLAAASVSAALEAYGDDLAVLWIDAHGDVNTPGTSETGNVHGMPLAALAGRSSGVDGIRDSQWNALVQTLGTHRLHPERTAWFALRDVDPQERPYLGRHAITMHDIDRHGITAMVERLAEWIRELGVGHLWVSFDIDSLDPQDAPGTGTAVRGGLTFREAHLLAELLYEQFEAGPVRLAGVDVLEVNPLIDRYNETAKMAVDWIASLFGKRILGPGRNGR